MSCDPFTGRYVSRSRAGEGTPGLKHDPADVRVPPELVDAATAAAQVLIRRGDAVEDISLAGCGANATELEAIARIADAKIASQGDYLQATETANVTPTPTLDPGSRQAILESALLGPDELPPGWISGHSNSEFDTHILSARCVRIVQRACTGHRRLARHGRAVV
jgi:hypothetical protein